MQLDSYCEIFENFYQMHNDVTTLKDYANNSPRIDA